MTPKKLLDDCFLHDRDRLRHDEALTILRERVRPVVGAEAVGLEDAGGRILAEPAVARLSVPAHTNAAVDGYAFAHSDYDHANGAILPVKGRAAAGHALGERPAAGSAVRIFTGAVMPDGLDTVVMQEDVEVLDGADGPRVRIPPGLKPQANVRRAGEDVAEGEVLLRPGHVLRPQDLAALASIGLAEVACFRRLKLAVVSTGDEIIRPGARELRPGEVYDANAPMLRGLARAAGCEMTDLGVWPDSEHYVRANLERAARQFDVILTSGGASRGEEDHMVRAIEALGTRHMWQLAIKPGRPMSFGQIGDCVVLGLPGNPVAVFVCFLLYGFPLLRRLSGAEWSEPRRYLLPAAFDYSDRKTGRREFWRGILVEREGAPAIDKFARDGSGLISGLRVADGLIEIAEDVPAVKTGDWVRFIPFSEFGIV
jgi:molybdopterin molybdotransferase